MKKMLIIICILFVVYIIICVLAYLFQEKIIFHPETTERNREYHFSGNFEELFIETKDGKHLNIIHFKADNSKGAIFYLHGNARNLESWGEIAEIYTNLQYDVFMVDYRGFGKSEGKISNENQLHEDVQLAYNQLKKRFDESKIVVIGYSVGTGMAAKVASENTPRLLILQSPYYNLIDIKNKSFPIVPNFVLKYTLKTNEFLKHCNMPVIIFHGDKDEVIYYGSSVKLKHDFPHIEMITLENQTHNGMTYNPEYQTELKRILE